MLLALWFLLFATSTSPPPAAGVRVVLAGLEARAWTPIRPSASPHLVIVLHGDLAGPTDSYQYDFARSAEAALNDTVVVAILRPGYADGLGAHSPGKRGLTTGDNYTPEVIAALRSAILTAKAQYHAGEVTLVGHSGGAVLAADLAEADPGLASKALLVSCPCDLKAWRSYRAGKLLRPVWLLPVRSRSPLEGVKRLSPRLQLRLVSGAEDDIAPPRLAKTFTDAVRSAGAPADLTILPKAGHSILMDPRILTALVKLQVAG